MRVNLAKGYKVIEENNDQIYGLVDKYLEDKEPSRQK
jgi:hypothetical protein